MPERRVTYQTTAKGQNTGLIVTAPSWQRLFVDAGLSLNDYRVSLDLVKPIETQTLSVVGKDLKDLMGHWLNAVAQLYPQKKFLAYRIVFTVFDGKKIEATLTGETYESHRHGFVQPFVEVHEITMGEAGTGFTTTFFLKS